MSNDETQMTKEARITKHETMDGYCLSSFVLRHSFLIWLSSFVILKIPDPADA